jgi:erythromycin esterase
VLNGAEPDAYLLDLRDEAEAAAPEPVRTWLDSPARTRLVGPAYDPAADAAHHLSGGALTDWFDALAHVREVTPARPL